MRSMPHTNCSRRFASAALLLLAGLCLAPAARAEFISHTISGDTAGGPTFNRPGAPDPRQEMFPYKPTTLSGFEVSYSAIPFTVSLEGDYRFFSASQVDDYLLLYRDNFDPSSPLNNVLLARAGADEDKGSFTAALSTGVIYYAVVTASRPGAGGPYTLDVQGYGDVNFGGQTTPTPEPASIALLATGLYGAGTLLRRRRKLGRPARRAPQSLRPAAAALYSSAGGAAAGDGPDENPHR